MRRSFCAAFLLLALPSSVWAQSGQVTGIVTGEGNQPLAAVSVTVAGTGLTAVTSSTGRFVLSNVPVGTHEVEATRLGYAPVGQEVTVVAGETVEVDFALDVRAIALQEIVAVGYGTQRREQVTTAVASVTAEEFVEGPARDAGSMIAGLVPGLTVNTPTGDPRDGTEIMLRGVTTIQGSRSPLVLIDGVEGSLETVGTQDIESISVLKDGSAASIYGSRASNGVILITTRRHQGGAPTFRYDSYIAQERIAKVPDLLTAEDHRRLIAEGNSGFTDLGFETDWIDELTREPFSHRHSLSVSGGEATTNYTASLTYEDTQGTFIRSNREEVIARGNIGHTMFDGRLEVRGDFVSRSRSNFTGPDYDWAWHQAINRNPLDGPKNPDGTWRQTSTGALRYENPLSLVQEHDGESENRQQRMHATVTFRPLNRLNLSLMGGTTKTNALTGDATTHRHQWHTEGGNGGTASRSTSASRARILELTGTWSDQLGPHSVTLLGGYSYQDSEFESFNASNGRFPTDLFGYNQLQSGAELGEGRASMSSNFSDFKLIGVFGRLNYDWENRYLLTGSLRYEGNSRFGEGHKWGVFPALSAAWRITEESFMGGVELFDDLRLRAGYGVTGIAPGSSYLSLTSFSYGARILNGATGQWVQGLAPARNPNPDLRWEQKEEINVGVSFSMLDHRLSGALDVYRRDTKDMLYNYSVPVPPNLTGSILANVGHMQNDGVELELDYEVINRPGVSWTTGGNWSTNTNKLVSLSDEVFQAEDFFYAGHTAAPIQQTTHRVEVGGPIGNFYGYESVDIDEAGEWIVLDRNGERAPMDDVTAADRRVLGNGIPDHFFAWNNTLRFGNLDFRLNMRGARGHQILNFLRLYYENSRRTEYNMLRSAFDPVYGKQPVTSDLAYVSYYIEDGDYLKIDNLTLGYTFREGSLGPLTGMVGGARVYVSGRNLYTFTGYQGLDPEVSISGLSPGNDDRNNYPTSRTFTAGVSVQF